MRLVGDSCNPTQRPYTPPASNITPFTPSGYSSVRHPNSDYSQEEATNLDVVLSCSKAFQPKLYKALTVNNWLQFSNHTNGHYSLESVHDSLHDSLHDTVGGNGGHMAYADVAAMDPIFFLHHANVNRLLAIWQVASGDKWMITQPDLGESTYLEPFRKDGVTFFTSKDVR
ncbi:hypothetical protein BC937DRAFT_86547 [Endogone sp. FLAS-F59071]|nr:hypothetical protein BC937DRAFT_86547 [Endogone sp. FLAS-F59071]|eukprot:RUS20032.1 hypothetical protein BC937DRAFT_86547 [Endogone sp. FLAS-F59071]